VQVHWKSPHIELVCVLIHKSDAISQEAPKRFMLISATLGDNQEVWQNKRAGGKNSLGSAVRISQHGENHRIALL